MFWTEIEFLFYAMTKKNKNKGKNPKPIPLTKYTNMLELKEEVKTQTYNTTWQKQLILEN